MRVQYPLAYNPIVEYWDAIRAGREIVGNKIRRTIEKLIGDLNDTESEWTYSPKRANHFLEFAENYCRLIQGSGGGKLIKLELWEKAMLSAIFGFVDADGFRKYREAILIIGKKNGKSLIASIVGLYMLLADGEAGPEVYAVATKRDQARKVWLVAKQMARKSPELAKRLRLLVGEISSDEFNNGFFKPLASDADTLDGLNIHCALMDELQQWKNGRALFDIIADGVTAREQPLTFITTTAGTIREDIYDQKYDEAEMVINGYGDPNGYKDERLIAFIYEIDKRAEWTDPKCWRKANPGLGTIKRIDQLQDKVKKAMANPALVKNLVCKEFNIRETSSEAWLTKEQVDNRETFDLAALKPRYGIGGADLSSTTDLTAAKVIFMVRGDRKIYVLSMYWMPEDLVEKRVREDKVPYDAWIEKGFVRACPGKKISYKMVTEWFREVQEKLDIYIPWVGYDAWSANYWVDEMAEFFGESAMKPVIQGAKTLSGPMKALGADLDDHIIIYNDNPVDKWCLYNTACSEDRNGNIVPVKTSRPTKRIDGTAALLNAYVILQEKQADYASLI